MKIAYFMGVNTGDTTFGFLIADDYKRTTILYERTGSHSSRHLLKILFLCYFIKGKNYISRIKIKIRKIRKINEWNFM